MNADKLKCIDVRDDDDDYTIEIDDHILYANKHSTINLPIDDKYEGKFIYIIFDMECIRSIGDNKIFPTLNINDTRYWHAYHDVDYYTMTYTLHYHDEWNIIGINYVD